MRIGVAVPIFGQHRTCGRRGERIFEVRRMVGLGRAGKRSPGRLGRERIVVGRQVDRGGGEANGKRVGLPLRLQQRVGLEPLARCCERIERRRLGPGRPVPWRRRFGEPDLDFIRAEAKPVAVAQRAGLGTPDRLAVAIEKGAVG